MLTGTGLSDDAFFTHTKGQQDLTHAVIDLMCTCVVQIFPFQVNLGTAEMFRQTFRKIKRAFAAHIVFQQTI